MKFYIKEFIQLSRIELYQILQLRSEVFVVEQNCVYQDIDGKDEKALHVLGIKNNKIIAYTRIFKSGDYFNEASIGRVVVQETHRNFSYGHELMTASIQAIQIHFRETKITISAQLYLKNFYEAHGFFQQGEAYLEDDIPHIRMVMD